MAIEYLKRPLNHAAAAALAATAVVHPGGEATVRHYPDGHAEIGSVFEFDLSEIDPNERLLRRYWPGSVTLTSSATAVFTLI